MFESIPIEMLLSNGIFAGLFVSLYRYTIKKNDEREDRYLGIINSYSESLQSLKETLDANTVILEKLCSELERKEGI